MEYLRARGGWQHVRFAEALGAPSAARAEQRSTLQSGPNGEPGKGRTQAAHARSGRLLPSRRPPVLCPPVLFALVRIPARAHARTPTRGGFSLHLRREPLPPSCPLTSLAFPYSHRPLFATLRQQLLRQAMECSSRDEEFVCE